ncbi:metal ABC transporter substrate-binding protein [[Clostridium] fimetarium]|uniref:Zinc transport system substrate-binding protein n=1 Tax=[Clostridium] fimetarium TaxID=99656 RepID=A0A1I0RUD1_9FIRM|nr:metal ABC transporter substrate-binding protein [[Clostridium] fimetarium]SEW44841.1 zinc transport system substrate-binding protein [[Clostridium] fimetarium]
MKIVKKSIVLFLCLISIATFTACGNKNQESVTGDKIKVSVTFNAIKEFVEAIGGDKVEISTIIPDGTEPHDFEPKAQDLVGISNANVFVYNGFGMETWVDDAISNANNKNLITVEASDGATPISSVSEAEKEEHGQYDPHLWISLKGAKIEANNIKEALVKADPTNKDYYEKNSDTFNAELDSLYNKYNEKFKSVANKSFVTGHAAFAYLCQDFGLQQNSVEGVFAEGEPTAKQLSELVDYCKKNNVKTIFAEDMASPDVSKTLASEVGAEVKTIYTIESSEDDKTYIERMTDNLDEIYDSLSK